MAEESSVLKNIIFDHDYTSTPWVLNDSNLDHNVSKKASKKVVSPSTKLRRRMSCVVPGCNFYKKVLVSFHKFPLNLKLRNNWFDILKISDKSKKHPKICSVHFLRTDFFPSYRKRFIKNGALPSLYISTSEQNEISCAAKLCCSNTTDTLNVTFIPFPGFDDLAKVWASRVKCEEQGMYQLYLCSNHFEGNYKNLKKIYLKTNVMPLPIPAEFEINDNYDLGKGYCRLCANLFPFDSLFPITEMEADLLKMCISEEKFQLGDNLPQAICPDCKSKVVTCSNTIKGFIKAHDKLCKIVGPNLLIEKLEDPLTITTSSVNDIKIKIEKPDAKVIDPQKIEMSISQQINDQKSEMKKMYQCLECNKMHNAKEEFVKHALDEHPSSKTCNKIVCKVISVNSKNEKKIASNLKKLNSNKVANNKTLFECVICSSFYKKKSQLVKHVLLYHSGTENKKVFWRVINLNKKENLKCLRCDEVFSDVKIYRTHIKMHMDDQRKDIKIDFSSFWKRKSKIPTKKIISCEKCRKIFQTTNALERHVKRHKELDEFTCSICNQKFENCTELFIHKKIHEQVLCYVCGKILSNTYKFKDHLMHHSTERLSTCTICKKTYKSEFRLKQHQRLHATSSRLCPICGKAFKNLTNLNTHMISHSVQKPYKCSICSANFMRKQYLQKHLKQHNLQGKSNTCKICNKDFDNIMAYLSHRRVEHGQIKKSFPCDICLKKFSTKFQAKIHYRIHTGESPFNCEHCFKSFRSLALLKQHRLIHLEVYPHQCKYCDRKFRRLQSLIVHRRTHTGEKPFPCPICGRAFANRGDMRKHVRIHFRKQLSNANPVNEIENLESQHADYEVYVEPNHDSINDRIQELLLI